MVEKTETKLEDETHTDAPPAADVKDATETTQAPAAQGTQPDPEPSATLAATDLDAKVDEHTGKLEHIEDAFEDVYAAVQKHLRGRYLAAVEHKLEEAFMWAKHGLSKL